MLLLTAAADMDARDGAQHGGQADEHGVDQDIRVVLLIREI